MGFGIQVSGFARTSGKWVGGGGGGTVMEWLRRVCEGGWLQMMLTTTTMLMMIAADCILSGCRAAAAAAAAKNHHRAIDSDSFERTVAFAAKATGSVTQFKIKSQAPSITRYTSHVACHTSHVKGNAYTPATHVTCATLTLCASFAV